MDAMEALRRDVHQEAKNSDVITLHRSQPSWRNPFTRR